jgi:uncharacterized protein YjiS (DUF1127 family)
MNALFFVGDRYGTTLRQRPTVEWRRQETPSHARSIIRRTLKGFAEARRISRAYDEFAAASDSSLQDIGISRAGISVLATATLDASSQSVTPLHASGEKDRHCRNGLANPCDQECLHD